MGGVANKNNTGSFFSNYCKHRGVECNKPLIVSINSTWLDFGGHYACSYIICGSYFAGFMKEE